MNKFYYSRTYVFDSPAGGRKHYFFNLVERHADTASFRLRDKDNTDTVSAKINTDYTTEEGTESVSFEYKGIKFELSGDKHIPKGYPMAEDGHAQKREDYLKDAHIHTSWNAFDCENAKECACICCERIGPIEDFMDFDNVIESVDNGETMICPFCGCDSLIFNSSGFKLTKELISELTKKYF